MFTAKPRCLWVKGDNSGLVVFGWSPVLPPGPGAAGIRGLWSRVVGPHSLGARLGLWHWREIKARVFLAIVWYEEVFSGTHKVGKSHEPDAAAILLLS